MKLKTIIFTAIGLCSFSTLSVNAQSAKPKESTDSIKIGYIDKELLVMQLPDMLLVQDSLIKVENSYASLYQQMEAERSRKIEELIKTKDNLTENMLMLKQKEINDLSQNMQFLEKIAMQDYQTIRQNLEAPLHQKVDSVLELIGKEYKFTYITKVRWIDPMTNKPIEIMVPAGENVMPIAQKKLGLIIR